MCRDEKTKCVMIIAGEASGDMHGAKLVRALLRRSENIFFFGIGGEKLKNAGVRILVESSTLSVVGITEAISKLKNLWHGIRVAKKLVSDIRPDLLILIDFPDFNLHIAKTAKKFEVPVLYYISPQIWAWRQGRAKKIADRVDHIAVILPFEVEFFKKYQLPATFVGHPLLDRISTSNDSKCKKTNHFNEKRIIGLLPGSRDREIARHLPVMIPAALKLKERIKDIHFIISIAPTLEKEYMETFLDKVSDNSAFELVEGGGTEMIKDCELVIAASGTVTLETAIVGTPMIVIYKVSPVSYRLGKAMIRVKNACLANLIAGKTIVPELIQENATPENIASMAYGMLSDKSQLLKMRNELTGVKEMLGQPGASARVADIAMKMLNLN